MTLKRFLLYTRFGTQCPKGISSGRWNAMRKFAETKIHVRDAARKRDGVYTVEKIIFQGLTTLHGMVQLKYNKSQHYFERFFNVF